MSTFKPNIKRRETQKQSLLFKKQGHYDLFEFV